MALSVSLLGNEIKKLTEAMRPPPNLRDQVDISSKFEDQTLEIFEIRPRWNNPSIIDQQSFAKARFIKSKSCWRIYWRRASMKWELYDPIPEVSKILEFFKIVNEDKYHAFKG